MASDGDGQREYKRPESVLVVVHTRALQCLLLERVAPRGFWQSVTGSLRWDETPAECAARELREETGLDGAQLRDANVTRTFPIMPQWRARYAPGTVSNLEHRWYLEVAKPANIRIAAREHVAYEWLPLKAAIARVSSSTNRDALEQLLTERQ
jgi:dATP pyrophosphohydrolase